MEQYKQLVNHVLTQGTIKENRTGVNTLGVFGYFYKCDLQKGFPLLTTKNIQWKHIVLENMWFLSGNTDINFLHYHGVKFWDPWADENEQVPSAYGNFWRKFPVHRTVGNEQIPSFNDQIAFAIRELRNNPLSRRIVINAWAPGNAQTSALPPCHVTWVLNTQKNKEGDLCLNLALLQRSCDIALGVPYNLAGYSFLLHLFAHLTNLKVGEFAHTLVDAHIYVNHIEGLQQQVARPVKPLPLFCIDESIKEISDIENMVVSRAKLADILGMFRLYNYDPHPAISFEVAV